MFTNMRSDPLGIFDKFLYIRVGTFKSDHSVAETRRLEE